MFRESSVYLNDYKDPSSYLDLGSVPPACRKYCNHISNGGSGICNCILGDVSQIREDDCRGNTTVTTSASFELSYQLTTTDHTLSITGITGEPITVKTNATDIFKMML